MKKAGIMVLAILFTGMMFMGDMRALLAYDEVPQEDTREYDEYGYPIDQQEEETLEEDGVEEYQLPEESGEFHLDSEGEMTGYEASDEAEIPYDENEISPDEEYHE